MNECIGIIGYSWRLKIVFRENMCGRIFWFFRLSRETFKRAMGAFRKKLSNVQVHPIRRINAAGVKAFWVEIPLEIPIVVLLYFVYWVLLISLIHR